MNVLLPINFNMCFGCSKESSHWDGSFEYPQHMFWLRNCIMLLCDQKVVGSNPAISTVSLIKTLYLHPHSLVLVQPRKISLHDWKIVDWAIKYQLNFYIVKRLFFLVPTTYTGPRSAVGNVSGYRCVSDCRSRGREFDPGPVPYFRGD